MNDFSVSSDLSFPVVSVALQQFLLPDQLELVEDSLRLARFFQKENAWQTVGVHDFAFLVFPMAKAYEGFLKEYLYRLKLIDKKQYEGRFFRIGRSFNPDLPNKLRDEDWLYDNVANLCDPETARFLWQTWLDARNHLFHFFPNDRYDVTYPESVELLSQVLSAMDRALLCQPQLAGAARHEDSPDNLG